jgi:sulfate adenylyltransferase large subunit
MTGQERDSELLRFATAGSVDDGKSTLIGRLLHDTKSVFEDQLAHVTDVSHKRGDERVDLALLTDGLRAEREQGITIDVAYRYFATRQRKFIIADTPGHTRYTRNMVTGASTASLAVVLVDARRGLDEQCRRHAYIASLLRLPHLVFAVNKMDLVDWDESVFRGIEEQLRDFAARLDIQDIVFIPTCAVNGANVVERAKEMPWYHGPTLLHHLENVYVAGDRNLVDVRFPVQWVVRPRVDAHHDFRGLAGQVAGGVLRPGDDIVVLPSGEASKIRTIEQAGRSLESAYAPMSVTLTLEDNIDAGRGDVICRPHNRARVGQDVDAMLCWFSETPLSVRGRYAVKHTSRWTRAIVQEVLYRVDVHTGHRDVSGSVLRANDIGRVALRTTTPLVFDAYRRNRTMGAFILVDETSNETVGAGMLLDERR